MKDVAGLDALGSLAIMSNIKVTTFNANRALQQLSAELEWYSVEDMLTRNTECLRSVSFRSLSTNMNSPLRTINVDNLGLCRASIAKTVFHASAVFIQVTINTKRSDKIAIALVRTGTVPANLINRSITG